ncbi:hypothetical protein K1719_015803 [Acacia pycnantha]|nr:hypothetical protein K1719_015803 [Acacia pycnantha]
MGGAHWPLHRHRAPIYKTFASAWVSRHYNSGFFFAALGRLLFSAGLYQKVKYEDRVELLWEHVRRKEMKIPESCMITTTVSLNTVPLCTSTIRGRSTAIALGFTSEQLQGFNDSLTVFVR